MGESGVGTATEAGEGIRVRVGVEGGEGRGEEGEGGEEGGGQGEEGGEEEERVGWD